MQFRGKFRVIRPDARGHGRSSAPPGPWSLADFISDLVAIMDRLEVERAHVAGFSMGGLLAQGLALSHPDRVGKLAIIAATTGRSPEEQAQVEERLAYIRANHPASYFDRHAAKRWFTQEFSRDFPEVIDYARRVVAANDHDGYANAYQVLVTNDLGGELSRIRHKALVLTGENDIGAGPKVASFIADQIAGSHLIVLPRLRHQLLLEAPELVGGILREFFSDAD
jgi:pimeloyl-ACP methyl ester carboxylesterase